MTSLCAVIPIKTAKNVSLDVKRYQDILEHTLKLNKTITMNYSISLFLFGLALIASSNGQGGYDIEPAKPNQQYGPPGHTPGTPMGPIEYLDSNSNDTSVEPEPTCTDKSQDPQANKANVIKFYEEMFGKRNFDSVHEFIGPMYIQHNPMVLDGKENLIKTLNGPFWSKLTDYKIYRISAEDDLVWVHDRMDFGDKSYVFLDILRFECGKIVEHWDVIQPITGMEINPKAFF